MSDTHSVKILSRRLVAENLKFNLYFDHVVDATGLEVPEYLVVAPKIVSDNMVTGVAILPIQSDKIGLIRIYRPALRGYSWEIPHGFVEEAEDNKLSAIRELMEETGLQVNDIRSLGYFTPDGGILAARVHLYLAQDCQLLHDQTPEVGLREFQFFSRERFEQMIIDSEVQDAFTLSAWCKYRLMQTSAP